MWSRLLGLGVRRGFLGGSRAWTVVGVLAGIVRLVKWMDRERVVHREVLQPGESIIIKG
ncbi:MAG TPA: hypothetical protein VM030_01210 [Acidimicrobiales bacterium]|nr:hypothetical protein [Acidimicrobiales bacterium]